MPRRRAEKASSPKGEHGEPAEAPRPPRRRRGPGRPPRAEVDPNAGGADARILEAAERLIAERGYDGTSVQDVASAAGVHKALVFYYFQSKEALFARVLERYYRAQVEAFEGAFTGGGDLAERVERLMDVYLDFMDRHALYPRLVQQEVARGAHGGPIRDGLVALLRWTESALAGAAPADGPLAGRQFFLTVAGMVITYYTFAPVLGTALGPEPLGAAARADRAAHVRWVTRALLRALQAEGAA